MAQSAIIKLDSGGALGATENLEKIIFVWEAIYFDLNQNFL